MIIYNIYIIFISFHHPFQLWLFFLHNLKFMWPCLTIDLTLHRKYFLCSLALSLKVYDSWVFIGHTARCITCVNAHCCSLYRLYQVFFNTPYQVKAITIGFFVEANPLDKLLFPPVLSHFPETELSPYTHFYMALYYLFF